MVKDISHMAILRVVNTGPLSEGAATSGWSHKTWKNPRLDADPHTKPQNPLHP
jgi:hypothetical protein